VDTTATATTIAAQHSHEHVPDERPVSPARSAQPAGGRCDPVLGARPRIRHDVLFADAGDGALLRSADGGFLIRGRSAYRLTSMLVPYLTGENTVAQLCADLPEAQRSMVTNFVRTLLERGYARDARPSEPVDLSPAVSDRFGSQINYIDHYVDEAAARFARFRASRVLITGTGPVAHAAATSLIRNGMRAVCLLPTTSDATTRLTDLAAAVETLSLAGCPAEVRVVDTPLDRLGAVELAAYDVVVAPAEDRGLAHLLRFSSLRSELATVLLPAAVVGGMAVLGPLVRPDTAPCWVCAALRLGANLDAADVLDLWRDASLPRLAGSVTAPSQPVAAMIGNMLGYEVFRLRTGCLAAETDGAVVVQDLSTLDVSRETLLAHPLCPSCGDGQSGGDDPARGDGPTGGGPVGVPPGPGERVTAAVAEHRPVTPESGDETAAQFERMQRHLTLVGTHVGVFTAFDDSAIDQSPLKVGRVRIGSADRARPQPRTVAAFDLHNVLRARSRAVHAAALVYTGQAVNTRGARVASRRQLIATDHGPVAHHTLTTWTGLPADDDRVEPWLPAVSLLSQEVRLVPAAAVYPFAGVNRDRLAEPSTAGAGAGPTVAEAIGEGLLSALAYAALRDAVCGRRLTRPILLDSAEVGSELDFLLRTAHNLDLPFELLRLSGSPAPVVLATAAPADGEEPRYAVGASLSLRRSVVDALRDLIGAVQLGRQFGPDAPVDLGDPFLSGLDARALGRGATAGHGVPDDSDRTGATTGTVDGILDHLRATGRDAFVVTTTTPDLAAGAVETVRVLLTVATGATATGAPATATSAATTGAAGGEADSRDG
jgi:bacteriocin biosynthesis cyclodehydratase domain-containing protein